MFEGLKKKFSEFVDTFSKKEEKKAEEEAREEKSEEPQAARGIPDAEYTVQQKEEEKKTIPEVKEKIIPEKPRAVRELERAKAPALEHEIPKVAKREEAHVPVKEAPKTKYEPHIEPKHAESKPAVKEKKPDVTFATKIRGTLLGEVKIGEKDIDPFLEQLRIALLQTDVNFDVAEKIVARMRENMVGSRISARSVGAGIKDELRKSILDIMSKTPGVDVVKLAEERKAKKETPFKILFVGPNGAGKTTTMAKMASMLGQRGIRCAISASDTFRAAAIEQAVIHARLAIGSSISVMIVRVS